MLKVIQLNDGDEGVCVARTWGGECPEKMQHGVLSNRLTHRNIDGVHCGVLLFARLLPTTLAMTPARAPTSAGACFTLRSGSCAVRPVWEVLIWVARARV